jgi:hypothetical protein
MFIIRLIFLLLLTLLCSCADNAEKILEEQHRPKTRVEKTMDRLQNRPKNVYERVRQQSLGNTFPF